MGGNAVLIVRSPSGAQQVFTLLEHTYRKELPGDYPFTITLNHIGSPLMVQGQDGTSVEIKPGEHIDFHSSRLFFETSDSLCLKMKNRQGIEEAYSFFERVDCFLDLSPKRSMIFARFFLERGEQARSFWHLARTFAIKEKIDKRGPAPCVEKPTVSDFLYLLSRLQRDGMDEDLIQTMFNYGQDSHPGHPALANWYRTNKDKARVMRNLSLVFAQSSITLVEEDEWHTYQGSFFKLTFPTTLPLKWVEICRDTIQRAKYQLSQYIHHSQPFELQMIRLDQVGQQVRGMFYEGRIVINMTPVLNSEEIESFRNTIKHEFIHMLNSWFICHNQDRVLPRWLDEGLAYFLAGNLHPETTQTVHSITTLESMFQVPLGLPVDETGMSTACKLVAHLVEEAKAKTKLRAAVLVLDQWTRPGQEQQLNAILELLE